MRTALLAALLSSLAAACTPSLARACWVPDDAAPGWKQVTLPAGAPSLAAPPDIDQYRPGETALAWEEREAEPASWGLGGRAELALPLDGAGWDVVEVAFAARLGGAGVEARGLLPSGSYLVLPRTRIHTATVRLEPADRRTTELLLTVHHHLRAAPRPIGWRVGRWLRPAGTPRTLVYRQPPGRPVVLCDAPGRMLELHPAWQTPPLPVTLTPQPWTARLRP